MVLGHLCDAPVSVLVHNDDNKVRIPIIDEGITVHEWKDGPMSFSRRAEVDFPIEAFGWNWADQIDGFHEEARFQEATVLMRKMDNKGSFTSGEVPVLRGYIGAVGSNGPNTGHITIFGPYKLLSHMPASKSIANFIHYDKVSEWFVDEINARQDIIADITPVYPSEEEIEEYIIQQRNASVPPDDDFERRLNEQVSGIDIQEETVSKAGNIPTWNPNRDTMADVARWLRETFNLDFYFDVSSDGDLQLVAQFFKGEQYDTTDNNDPDILANNAIYEMKPFNSVILRGDKVDLGRSGDETSAGRLEGYPRAIAWYPPLVERAGGFIPTERAIHGTIEPAKLAEKAQEELKNQLDSVSGGTMEFALWPQVQTTDRVWARPACNGLIDSDVPVLNYEVQRLAHTVSPSSDEIPKTETAVSMAIDPDMIMFYATVIDEMPSEELDNTPSEQPPWIPELDIAE